MRISVPGSNYTAKIVQLGEPRPHKNADRLQIFTVDFENIITDLSYKEGDIVVVFPIECQINESLISWINGFRDPELNRDKNQAGFFEKHRRVRAISLRGEKAGGFCVKWIIFLHWANSEGIKVDSFAPIGKEFDTIGDTIICNKYEPPKKPNPQKKGKSPVKGFSRLVDGQFRLHEDTANLRKNVFKLELTDMISITYKMHGTSAVFANVLTKVKRPWYDFWSPKVAYGSIYSSRKVVKNQFETRKASKFYDTDVWAEMEQVIYPMIPKGFTVYGEIVGYQSNGSFIQPEYDYGCDPGQKEFYLYRVTFTTADGHSYELNWKQLEEFATKYGFKVPERFFTGSVKSFLNIAAPNAWMEENWQEVFVRTLERLYNEKDCFMCVNKVPEEGVVVRKENLFVFEAYKLKSFKFLEKETKQLDNESIESDS